ncbi:MAG: AN1-type zinc finger domain-containing protein [Candidatus Kariarchaeaceae archaeon]|jgi:hypothetical protein
MVECSYCQDQVAMPFKCNLCSARYCGKHRLPESHECTNIGVFKTDEYRQVKLQKDREHRAIKTASDFSESRGPGAYGGYSRFGQTWTSGDKYKDLAMGGALLGLTGSIQVAVFSNGLTDGGFNTFKYMPFTMLFGIFFVLLLYSIRNYFAELYGVGTGVNIYPVGVAVTLIFAVFRFPWLLIGRFINLGHGDLEKEAKIGITTVVGSLLIYFIGYQIGENHDSSIFQANNSTGSYLITGILIGTYFTANLFVIAATLTMIPLWGMEGTIIYEWNSRNYFILLALVILSLIMYFISSPETFLRDVLLRASRY